jgi:hypothetical protein
MNTPWQFTTWLDAIDRWQGLLAGLIGFGAAILAVVLTLRSEQRKADRELEALRRSIGVEIRQCVAVASGTFKSLVKLAQKEDGPITYRMVESFAQFQEPLVFPAVADKIGLLGSQAQDILIFYSLVDIVRRGIGRLANYRTPDDISPVVVAGTANGLVAALLQGSGVIAALKTHEPTTDARDMALAAEIAGNTASWEEIRRQKWPEIK